ncbi:hypothetical protein ABW20_dc0110404 [Dactylellina cionopaga]|nr:hypothetical protein ABW20_dc0110404 [Dactylellina cionopaga]
MVHAEPLILGTTIANPLGAINNLGSGFSSNKDEQRAREVKSVLNEGKFELRSVERVLRNSQLTREALEQLAESKAQLIKEMAELDKLHKNWQATIDAHEMRKAEREMNRLRLVDTPPKVTQLLTRIDLKRMEREREKETLEYKKMMADKEAKRLHSERVAAVIEARLVYLTIPERDKIGDWVCTLPDRFADHGKRAASPTYAT